MKDSAASPAAVSCLVLVDLQAAFVTGSDAVPGAADLIAAATELLGRARHSRCLIIHLQNDGEPGTADETGTPGWELHLAPAAGELVIRKTSDDGFQGTDLGAILAARRVRRLAIAGVMSEMCVSATARTALSRGLAVVLPHDAHATYDIPDLPGISHAIPAATVARVAEWALGDQLELLPTSGDVAFEVAGP